MQSRHLCALTTKDPYGPFVTALVELKLDQSTMFEWQRQSQDASDTLHYERLLKFLDLKAQASESFVQGTQKHQAQSKPSVQLRSAHTTNVSSTCNICGAPTHPLFMCRKFKSLPCEQHINIVKQSDVCFNCFKPGHLNHVFRARNAKSVGKHTKLSYICILVLIPGSIHHRLNLANKEDLIHLLPQILP